VEREHKCAARDKISIIAITLTATESWRHDNTVFYPNSDVAFALYGTVGGAGNITALSATTLERSGYLEITGTNFGSDGTVLVDGVSAPVADWQSTKIVAYVPESTRLATVPVQMVNASGIAE
jgi:hypothetical protein